ncbi:MAG: lactate utilization protein B/C [Chitinophagaceae bacterium BSSC1]|nr:MAG: lactate utilization protein B/C [Chitinophagaceae bacterium BSSC1]
MSARETILAGIMANQPLSQKLPVVRVNEMIQYEDLVSQFKIILEAIGGACLEVKDHEELDTILQELIKEKQVVLNAINPSQTLVRQLQTDSLESLASIDMAIINGSLAVAESGAVWVSEEQMILRILPFITEQLVLVVDRKNMVSNMGQAYQQIDFSEIGFGAFIAGPSKTADIEQSLVIGAHGPKKSMVILVG